MKRFIFLFILPCFVALFSCADNETMPQINDLVPTETYDITQVISKEDALEIANKVLWNSAQTRSNLLGTPKMDYVINKMGTRSNSSAQDTLAYVINYPNDAGFVIVSTTRKVYPVLAFSDKGNFSFDNEIAENNFIDNIGAYIDEADESSTYEVEAEDFDECYVVDPVVSISLSQGSPWNKYVVEEHPGCPAGCVAVATALVMSYSKIELTYHGSLFKFKSMITAIENGPKNTNQTDSLLNNNPQMTYYQAVDSMARVLYWIGKDVNMQYSTNGSGAYSQDAYDLCVDLGFIIPSGYANFNINEITTYLSNDHIVFLRGRDFSKSAGHAWVSDGCYYCVDQNNPETILNTYIHCDWGWGGSCNGYYSSGVFSASIYNFQPLNYFAVKRQWETINAISR